MSTNTQFFFSPLKLICCPRMKTEQSQILQQSMRYLGRWMFFKVIQGEQHVIAQNKNSPSFLIHSVSYVCIVFPHKIVLHQCQKNDNFIISLIYNWDIISNTIPQFSFFFFYNLIRVIISTFLHSIFFSVSVYKCFTAIVAQLCTS